MHSPNRIVLGIYEKALPAAMSWTERLSSAAAAGYDFVEMSIDEADERLERLDWGPGPRAELRQAIADAGLPITTLCLSGHRRFPMGSASPEIRQKSLDMMQKAIFLAADVGMRMVQVAGYDVFYEPSSAATRARFMDGLCQAVEWASQCGVMLGLENVDRCLISMTQLIDIIRQFGSPWLQVYGDIGNLSAVGCDMEAELEAARGHLAGIHVKDTRAGEFRRVPLGGGTVPFVKAFRALWRIGFTGPMLLEMWGGQDENPVQTITESRRWLMARLEESWDEPRAHRRTPWATLEETGER
jgi:predicted hexulose-6-phosphate isomerase